MHYFLLLIAVSITTPPISAQWVDSWVDETSTTTPAASSATTTTTTSITSSSNNNSTKSTSFTMTACVTPNDVTLPYGVTFTPALSTTHCATGCQDACAAVLVATEVGGSKTCAVLARQRHIPVSQTVTCGDVSATVVVYTSSVDTRPTWTAQCHANITVWEDLNCLHDTGLATRSYAEARAHCEAMGGSLPEVETIPDLDVIKGLYGSLSYEFIWLGATDPYGNNTFTFLSGHEMPSDLWMSESSEPNNRNERCTAIAWYGTRKVIDFGCEGLSYDMKVMCAFKW